MVLFHLLQKKANGMELYEKVLYYQDLIETDYFGLQFTDHASVSVSADLVMSTIRLNTS